MTEKRQFKRAPLNVPVDVTAAGRALRFEARNISVGGLLLRGEETLPENTSFQMKFNLPRRPREICATAVVQHVSPDAFMGVRFEGLSEELRLAIEAYVKEALAPQT